MHKDLGTPMINSINAAALREGITGLGDAQYIRPVHPPSRPARGHAGRQHRQLRLSLEAGCSAYDSAECRYAQPLR